MRGVPALVDLRKHTPAQTVPASRHRRRRAFSRWLPRRAVSRGAVLALVALTAGSAAALPGSDPFPAAASAPPTATADGGAATRYDTPSLGTGGSGGTGRIGTPSSADLARVLTGGKGTTIALAGDDLSIPPLVLGSYKKAAATLAGEQPGCHLTWPVLAGIGRIESDHGRHGGSERIGSDGTVSPAILGPRLAGGPDLARITDTDHGRLDGDTVLDRAVGPMQFIPSTWATAGRDGNGDGRADPENVFDASLSAAGYLCAHGRDLATPAGLMAALGAYNPSAPYAQAVLAWAAGYASADPAQLRLAAEGAAGSLPAGPSGGTGVPVTETTGPPTASPHPTRTPTRPGPTPTRTPTPGPTPSHPASPTPTPSPTCLSPVVATPVVTVADTDADHLLDAVNAAAPVTVPVAGRYTLTTTLRDAAGYLVTSKTGTAAHPTSFTATLALAGRDVGDAGAAGPYKLRVEVARATGTAGCGPGGAATTTVTTIDPSHFVGWVTTLDRLRLRVTGYRAAGQLSGAVADRLTALIPARLDALGAANELKAFRTTLAALTTAGAVTAEASARLDSLAVRLIAQAPALHSGPTPSISTPPASPGPATASPAASGRRWSPPTPGSPRR